VSGFRIGLFGKGRLGGAIAVAIARSDCQLAWQVGREAPPSGPSAPVDCAIDATVGDAMEARLAWALEARTPLVAAATGWEILDLEQRVGDRIGLLIAPNLSLTVALYTGLARVLARYAALDPTRDPYVVEHHHKGKRDAPSGTARMLARAVLEECPRKERWVIPSADGPLAPADLSVSAVRAGYTASSHVVGVDAPGETLEIVHAARDLSPYGEGAVVAARWLAGRTGIHSMEDLAGEVLAPLFTWKRGRA
jgi:4-hydroxy-tetrahydrodipicolinate reductase